MSSPYDINISIIKILTPIYYIIVTTLRGTTELALCITNKILLQCVFVFIKAVPYQVLFLILIYKRNMFRSLV